MSIYCACPTIADFTEVVLPWVDKFKLSSNAVQRQHVVSSARLFLSIDSFMVFLDMAIDHLDTIIQKQDSKIIELKACIPEKTTIDPD